MSTKQNRQPKEVYGQLFLYALKPIEDAEWLGEPPDDEEECIRGAIKYCPPDLHAVLCN